jgi:hypothetical protein
MTSDFVNANRFDLVIEPYKQEDFVIFLFVFLYWFSKTQFKRYFS